jgi:DNA-binding FadR family transcriptional regulator
VVDGLFGDVVDGTTPVDAGLASEAEIGARFDVSRVTVREAIKTLQAQGVVRVESGKGSFVNPISEWSSLLAVLRASTAGADDAHVAEQLIELRQIFETGAAALAGVRRSDDDLAALEAQLAQMRNAHSASDVQAFAEADLAFHDTILKASRNVFLTVMFAPLTRVLAERRAETSRVPAIQRNAIREHERVLEALRTGDAETAKAAMESHMDQTLRDLRTYILKT